MLPLSDTLVLDLTQVIAGPTAGQILGDMGADVIQVEPQDGEMCRVGTAPIDYCTGSFCAAGIAFALLGRHKTGRGQRLDLSLFDVGMHMMSHWITNYGLKGENPVRMGTGNSLIFPLRVF